MATGSTQGGSYVFIPGGAERRWMGDTHSDFLATGDLTAGAFTFVDERGVRGEDVPLHTHPGDFEAFYVLEGEVTYFLDERTERVGPGGFVFIAGGTVHGFRIESEEARYLIITTPNHGDFFQEISDPARGGAWDWERIARACERHGVSPVGDLPQG